MITEQEKKGLISNRKCVVCGKSIDRHSKEDLERCLYNQNGQAYLDWIRSYS